MLWQHRWRTEVRRYKIKGEEPARRRRYWLALRLVVARVIRLGLQRLVQIDRGEFGAQKQIVQRRYGVRADVVSCGDYRGQSFLAIGKRVLRGLRGRGIRAIHHLKQVAELSI